MKTLQVIAQPRTSCGASAVGRLRRQGILPAVVYGAGRPGRNIQMSLHDFEQTLRGHAGEHLLMDLIIGNEPPVKVLLKEIQHHPVSGRMIHVDFHEVTMTKKLRVEIPIRLVGEPVGVSQQGGVLEHLIRALAVECLPGDMIEHIDLDVSGLHIGESLTVAHIQLDPTRFTVLTPPEVAVATVAAPRVEEEPVPAEVAAAELAAEPEVIREKKEEEVEAGEAAEKRAAKKEEEKQ